MNINVFYHMFCNDNCIERFFQTYDKIVSSKLLNVCTKVHVNAVGKDAINYADSFKSLPKIEFTTSANESGEMDTLDLLHNCSKTNTTGKTLYIHSKGASRNLNPNIKAWVDYMEYFLIEKHLDCLNALNTHDTTGVELWPSPMPHYSGNFWWANNSYLSSHNTFKTGLKTSTMLDPRWYCEFWLLHANKVNPNCMHKSNIDLYGAPYLKQQYEYN